MNEENKLAEMCDFIADLYGIIKSKGFEETSELWDGSICLSELFDQRKKNGD